MKKENFDLEEKGRLAEAFAQILRRHDEQEEEKDHEHSMHMLEDAAEALEILCEKTLEKLEQAFTPPSHSFGAPAPSCC